MHLIARDLVPDGWAIFRDLIEPAIAHDPNATPDDVYQRLETGKAQLFSVNRDNAKGAVIIEIADDLTCWVTFIGGWVAGGPKERLMFFRAELARLEAIARDAGCNEMVIGGRVGVYRRMFPDYKVKTDHPHELRKALANG